LYLNFMAMGLKHWSHTDNKVVMPDPQFWGSKCVKYHFWAIVQTIHFDIVQTGQMRIERKRRNRNKKTSQKWRWASWKQSKGKNATTRLYKTCSDCLHSHFRSAFVNGGMVLVGISVGFLLERKLPISALWPDADNQPGNLEEFKRN